MPEEIFEPLELPPGWTALDYAQYRNKVLMAWLIGFATATAVLAATVVVLVLI